MRSSPASASIFLPKAFKPETLNRQELGDAIFEKLKDRYDAKEKLIGPDAMRYHERMIMLSVLDAQWKDHLLDMDHLKEGIGLRGYGQHDPLVEYKRESFDMFEAMMQRFQEETIRYLYLMQILERPAGRAASEHGGDSGPAGPAPAYLHCAPEAEVATDIVPRVTSQLPWMKLKRPFSAGSAANSSRPAWPEPATGSVQQVVRGAAKIGRNDPCPCGSGKKYKKCCGAKG